MVASKPVNQKERPIQGIAASSEFPQDKIQQAWKANKRVENLIWTGNMWVLVTETITESTAQSLVVDSSFPKDDLKNIWQKGHCVQVLTYGDEQWVLISEKSNREQGYILCNGNFPMAQVKELLREGKAIHSITYANKEDTWVVIWEKRPFIQSIHVDKKFPEGQLYRFGF